MKFFVELTFTKYLPREAYSLLLADRASLMHSCYLIVHYSELFRRKSYNIM